MLPDHAVNTLGGIALPIGVIWDNENEFAETGQTLFRTLDGGIVNIEQTNNGIGQKITLLVGIQNCYFVESQLTALKALAATEEQEYTLAWGAYNGSWSTTNYTVIFDKSDGAAINMTRYRDNKRRLPILASTGAVSEIYIGQINLMRTQ